jgi:DNA mismatch repair protein MutS
MMEQYKAVKEQHPDKLLMFQVGDFYELFFEDAVLASREMEIALTSRDAGSENPIPLAGVPIHAAETYLNKLLARGHKVVICDQIESAQQSRGLVRRAITRILTPGTITDPEMLEEGANNYLAVIVAADNNAYGLASVDLSAGVFQITEQGGEGAWEIIADELQRLQPSEILCSSGELETLCRKQLKLKHSELIGLLPYTPAQEEARELIDSQWAPGTWQKLDLGNYSLAASSAAAALAYMDLLQQLSPGSTQFHSLELYFCNRNMVIDAITSRNLELTRSLGSGGRQGSLLDLIDRCRTGMGRRLLRRWIEQPLLDQERISRRLDSVEELKNKPLQRREIRERLRDIFDLERFCGRLSCQRVNARDLVALKKTVLQLGPLKKLLSSFDADMIRQINSRLPAFEDLAAVIDLALVEEPPLSLKEGGLFKKGYHEEVDRLKVLAHDGKTMLLDFEKREREKTGIKTMRIGYNRNFGYYIEVTKSNIDLVPGEYHRKQTLVNAERYTTEELQTMEEQITGARDKLAALEYALFEELRSEISGFTGKLLAAAFELATLDCLQGLAETAEKNSYCRPVLTAGRKMIIRQARHPVVEQLSFDRFVPNDITIDNNHYILVITGPNMAGKSTYIRSAALIAILAQMGSFVPAQKADLPVLDRVFARVGASDDLSRGQSTFMVEMQETATILKESTADSLVVLDEIGRGTSTYDGMSIARSVLEYISRKIKAKTLFSTHYHELTNLESELPGIKNYTMAVKEKGKQVIFLRQVIPGRADKSYGINVARLAGVPVEVLIRAEAILAELELCASSAAEQQLSLLPMVTEPYSGNNRLAEVENTLKDFDLNRMTPLDAMQALFSLQKMVIDSEPDTPEEDVG